MTSPLASAVMVAYCGWDPTVLVSDETVLLDGLGGPVLMLPSLHVTDVSAVEVTNRDGSVYTSTLTGTYPDVGWSSNGVLTWGSSCNGGVWPVGQQNVAVTYSGGYNGPPDDLQAALDNLTGRLAKLGWTTAKMGSAAVSFGTQIAQGGLLLIEQMVFDRYRLPRAA
jgi:hypothetical protein